MLIPFRGRIMDGPWRLTVKIRLPGEAVTMRHYANRSGTKTYKILVPPTGETLFQGSVPDSGLFQGFITIPSLSAGPLLTAQSNRVSSGSRLGGPIGRPQISSFSSRSSSFIQSVMPGQAQTPLYVAVQVDLPSNVEQIESGKHPYCFDMVDLYGNNYRGANGDFDFEPIIHFDYS